MNYKSIRCLKSFKWLIGNEILEFSINDEKDIIESHALQMIKCNLAEGIEISTGKKINNKKLKNKMLNKDFVQNKSI